MAKFLCVCGQSISTSGLIPNSAEWHLIPDTEFQDWYSEPPTVSEMFRRMRFVYRCRRSDHLWVFWDGLDGPPRLYSPTALPASWD
jgi:hypothetical protein